MRRTMIALALALTAGGAFALAEWFGLFSSNTPIPIPMGDSDVPYRVEEFATGLDVPWSMVWTSPGRMLVAERAGRIRIVENGQLCAEPLHIFNVSTGGEEGLMSLAVHPDYPGNHWVYAVYAYDDEGATYDRVVRFRDDGDSISNITTIVDGIPSASFHAGSRIRFGPDDLLYITTGDATDRDLAQDTRSLAEKILRVHDDGRIPSDNPFPDSPVWSYGHRNPQGIDWHRETGELYATEHGPSVFDGPAGDDEVNRIVRAGNYGWPLVSHAEMREGTIAPLLLFTPAEAPASAAFYAGDVFPQFKNNFFFGALRGEGLMRIVFDDDDPDAIIGSDKLFGGEYGRIRDVAQGPDGYLYFSTSNRDGRGSPAPNDDRILRIVPR